MAGRPIPSEADRNLSGWIPPEKQHSKDRILLGENLDLLPGLADESFQLIYIDPPFNTGSSRDHTSLRVTRDEEGRRTGFGGRRYRSERALEAQL